MTISVLMSVFNNEKTIERAIESILNQSYENFELLIMDDFSSDNSLEICKQFTYDNRVKVFQNSKNIGLTKSLNILAGYSSSEYLARQDADDESHVERFKIQKNVIEKYDYDIVTCRTEILNSKRLRPRYAHFIPTSFILKYKNPFIHGTTFLRRKIFYEIGGYDEDYFFAQDYKFFIDAQLYGCKIHTIKTPLYKLNVEDNISTIYKNEQKLFSQMASKHYRKEKK